MKDEEKGVKQPVAEMKTAEWGYGGAEEALRESVERYRRLLESITDYTYTVKVENGSPVSTTHGQGCLALTGYTPDYFQNNPYIWYQMIHEEDRDSVLKELERVLSGEVVQHIEHRIVHKDGSVRWVSNTFVPHLDKEGKLVAYDGIIEDITERRMAAEALRESEEKFRVIASSAQDGIIMMDEEGRISYWNPAAERMFGYSREEAIGKGLHELIVPEGQMGGFSKGFKRFQKTGEGPVIGKILELAGIRKDGREFYAEHSISAVKVKGKWNAIATVRDVTDRRKAEDAVKESFATIEKAKKEWEATFDGITDPIFTHDGEFRIVKANRAYQKVAGVTFDEIVGRPYYEVFPKMEGPFRMCLKALESRKEEEEYSCPLSKRIFNARSYPINNEKIEHLYSIHILKDVTEARRAEEKMKEEMEVTSHLLMIAEATSRISEMDRLMKEVIRCIEKLLGCDICLLYAWDADSKVFRPAHESGLPREAVPEFRTEALGSDVALIKRLLGGKEPVATARSIDDVMRVPPSENGMRGERYALTWLPYGDTVAGILLKGKKAPLGIIIAVFRHEKVFTERTLQVMQGMSSQVSIALEQARMYKESTEMSMELSHKIETIQVMHEIDRSILSTLESEEILETVVRLVGRIVSCERAAVVFVDMERDGFVFKAGFGERFIQKEAFIPFNESSAADVLKTGETEYMPDLGRSGALLPHEERLLKGGFLCHIRVPVAVKGKIGWILSVGSKRAASFTSEDLSTLEKVASQIGVALENARLVSDLEELFIGVVKSLSSAIDAKSPWTAGHSERVTRYAVAIGREMRLSDKELKDLELAGLLHDVGKIGTYEAILDKPGKLTPEELAVMRQHVTKSAEILDPIHQLKDVIPGIRAHHEYYDGTGYPDGLKGEELPLFARILAVADTVDAMGANRPYRDGRPMEVVIAELKKCSGTQFDPKVVEAFLKVVGKGEEFKMAAN